VVAHQLQVERRTGKVCRSQTDVLPLCHATNMGHYTLANASLFRGTVGDGMTVLADEGRWSDEVSQGEVGMVCRGVCDGL